MHRRHLGATRRDRDGMPTRIARLSSHGLMGVVFFREVVVRFG
jgi:hypothetical protein